MPFRFTLQAVLEHRVAMEEEQKRKFGDAQGNVSRLRALRERARNEMRSRYQEINHGQLQGVALRERALVERWVGELRNRESGLELEIKRAEENLEIQRRLLVETMRNREVIQQLRSKELKEYRRDEGRKEQKMFDEMAVREFSTEQRREKDARRQERVAS